ncbi:MAG: Hpt domain-containing protein [Krumholzibacteria bacterium]|nr:Hpt domain-containing protein [Candidatus Krumholzibacteria bacterium]
MSQSALDTASALDLRAAMGQMDGDAELLQEIVGIFIETGPEQLDAIAGALAAGDAAQVSLVAHGMKGGASNLCAGRFVASARELELSAKRGSLAGAAGLLARMRADFAELVETAAVVDWGEVQRCWQD